jgi:TonB family protein
MRIFAMLAFFVIVGGLVITAAVAGEPSPVHIDEQALYIVSARSHEVSITIAFDRPPILEHFVKPKYPALAREAGIEGIVRVKVSISVEGRVVAAELVRSDVTAGMEKAALAAARQCEFTPAMREGVPVEAVVMVPFNFRLEANLPKRVIHHRCSCRHEPISIQLSPEDVAKITETSNEPARTATLAFRLDTNYPNPFNPGTVIPYEIASPSRVRLNVYNVRGQLVRVLVDEQKDAGSYRARWDGTSAGGAPVASGMYFYRIAAGSFTQSRKMLLLK